MISPVLLRRLLLGTLLFCAVSSFGGAWLGIVANGGGVSFRYLQGSPFSSYLVPGLILGVVVGGTQLAAAVGLWRRSGWALTASVVAGFGMLIWIFVELAVITEYSALQTIYFALGSVELILVFGLLGIAPRLVRRASVTDAVA